MSKKMKGVVLDSSRYGQFEEAKARFKHQTLMQDFQELHKEAEAVRNKLQTMKQRKLTLLGEVRFLQRRYKYLLKNKATKSPQKQELVQKQIFETHSKKSVKENSYSRKEAKPRKEAPIVDVNQKAKIFSANESARRNPSPVLDLNHKNRIHSGKEAPLRKKTPGFDLNRKERKDGGKEASFRNPMPILDSNQRERLYIRKETTHPRNPAPAFDLNQTERTCVGRENAAQNRAPIFDLNQISGEEELQDHYEPSTMEKPKKILIGGGTDGQLNDLNLSVCRNVGNGPNRAGKRKISWQDQVALKV